MLDDNLLNRLLSVRALRIYEDCVIWDTVLNEAAPQLEQSDIPALCRLFYDEAGETEMMYNLIHLIEAIPGTKAEYAKNIAVCTPDMADGTEWARLLNLRIINSDEYRKVYAQVISESDKSVQHKILEFLRNLAENEADSETGRKFKAFIDAAAADMTE